MNKVFDMTVTKSEVRKRKTRYLFVRECAKIITLEKNNLFKKILTITLYNKKARIYITRVLPRLNLLGEQQ